MWGSVWRVGGRTVGVRRVGVRSVGVWEGRFRVNCAEGVWGDWEAEAGPGRQSGNGTGRAASNAPAKHQQSANNAPTRAGAALQPQSTTRRKVSLSRGAEQRSTATKTLKGWRRRRSTRGGEGGRLDDLDGPAALQDAIEDLGGVPEILGVVPTARRHKHATTKRIRLCACVKERKREWSGWTHVVAPAAAVFEEGLAVGGWQWRQRQRRRRRQRYWQQKWRREQDGAENAVLRVPTERRAKGPNGLRVPTD